MSVESMKSLAYQAKQRLKTGFWQECKQDIAQGRLQAKDKGLNENTVARAMCGKVQSSIKGEKTDDFYLKVKHLLDTEGEVSDAIGRLTDKEYYATLSYAERQRYTLELSGKYLEALEKYRKEKETTL
jgi:hypothetical protein